MDVNTIQNANAAGTVVTNTTQNALDAQIINADAQNALNTPNVAQVANKQQNSATTTPNNPQPVTNAQSTPNAAHDAIAANYQAQIDALMQQNAQLNAQIVQLINSGAQLRDSVPQPQTQPQTPAYMSQVQQMQSYMQGGMGEYSIDSLAAQIGAKE